MDPDKTRQKRGKQRRSETGTMPLGKGRQIPGKTRQIREKQRRSET